MIIEVSRPRANLNGLGGLSNNAYYLPTAAGDKAYPTQLYISPDRTAAGLTSESEHRRSRSFVSPEHELPRKFFILFYLNIYTSKMQMVDTNSKSFIYE